MPRRSIPFEEEAQRRELYESGFNDYQIAAVVGSAPVTIAGWRRRRGLPPNTPAGKNSRGDPSITEMTDEMRRTSKKLLEKGVSVKTISSTFGLSIKTLERYRGIVLCENPELRRSATLSPPQARADRPKYSKLRLDRRRQAFIMYAEGWSDCSIAAQIGVERPRVRGWRVAFNLAPNFARGEHESPRLPAKRKQRRALPPAISPHSNPLYARVAEAIGRSLSPDITDDAISDLMLAVLEGRITEDQLVSGARSVRSKVLQSYASRWSRSLDEDLGDDGFRMIDHIRDDSSSSWLERMGATVW